MPFVIIEFGQLEETVGEQLEEKMVIEKYLVSKNIYPLISLGTEKLQSIK